MSDAFVSLATILRPPLALVEQPDAPPAAAPSAPSENEAMERLLSEVRCFRAHLAEAFDARLAGLLRDLACNVLARDLESSPADLAALAAEALDVARDEMPLRLRASQDDCAQLVSLNLPVIADATLRSGDLIVELHEGELDLRLGVRLDAMLRGDAR